TEPPGGILRWIIPLVLGIPGLAAAVTAVQPRHRYAGWAAIVLMLALVWLKASQVDAESNRRAPFQKPMMTEARANMQRLLEPNAVVITSEDVGRPAENIDYYSGVAHALYLTDLRRWHVEIPSVAVWLAMDQQRPYLFLPAAQEDLAQILAH